MPLCRCSCCYSISANFHTCCCTYLHATNNHIFVGVPCDASFKLEVCLLCHSVTGHLWSVCSVPLTGRLCCLTLLQASLS
jgi:hypothetical protein